MNRQELNSPPQSHAAKTLLRFITCGSVDDGKSSLIGRLLYETHAIFDDQLQALASESKRLGTRGSDLDFALLVDGLAAEREQGITIDVAYRYFETARRKFIVADTPGHEQYTRNMVTGASTADVAILLIDARKGLLEQTKRHSYIASLLGIRHVVLAVNKMDLVGFDERIFRDIENAFRQFSREMAFTQVIAIPVCAVDGDNVSSRSPRLNWYQGEPLLDYLESVTVDRGELDAPFRFPVQWVNRPHADFRGYSGQIASGVIRPGDKIRVLPSGRQTSVESIVTYEGALPEAIAGQSVTLTVADEVDISRGDVLTLSDQAVECGAQFEATLVWMHQQPLLQGRQYFLKIGTRTALCTVAPVKYRVNIHTMEHVSAERLEMNDIGVCELQLDQSVPFEPYTVSRILGGFILIDRLTNDTVGAGMLHFALRRSQNVHWQALAVDRALRSAQKQQRSCVLWLTGLSGAGKSTIADILDQKLLQLGHHSYVLDGDNVRHGLNKDLGFTAQDRVENIRRVAEVSKLMVHAGLITLVSFISPFRSEREMARSLFDPGEFIEVFVDTTLAVAEQRDVKGLYKKARAGKLKNFTGIDSPYEAPQAPEIYIDTAVLSAMQAADLILSHLRAAGFLVGPTP